MSEMTTLNDLNDHLKTMTLKAISVKYIQRTEKKQSRLKAFDLDGNSVMVNYDSNEPGQMDETRDDKYWRAAKALLKKMGWEGSMVCGWPAEDVAVFVFIHTRVFVQ